MIGGQIRCSRRSLLRAGSAALLAAGLWPGSLFAAQPETQDFDFIFINDLHYTDAGCDAYFTRLVGVLNA